MARTVNIENEQWLDVEASSRQQWIYKDNPAFADELPHIVLLACDGDLKEICVNKRSEPKRIGRDKPLVSRWTSHPEAGLEAVMPRLLMGLQYAIKNFCAERPGLHFRSIGVEVGLPIRLKALLYRSVQELVNNAFLCGGAESVYIELIAEDGYVSLTVHDDGCGFDPETVSWGNGLINIFDCAIAYDGRVNIYSSPQGSEIAIEIEQAYAE